MKDTPDAAIPRLEPLDDDALLAMRDAAEEARAAMTAAYRGGSNIVHDILRFEGEIEEDQHYPDDNIRDPDSGAQYYYHCHREGEHGHFHCFIMDDGLDPNLVPVPNQRLDLRDPDYPDPFVHLAAISMDAYGQPKQLFTTNRWVTQEVVYPAETVIGLLDRFAVEHSNPAWSTNRWITAMLRLFRPQIVDLLHARDAEYRRLAAEHPDRVIFEDEEHEILSVVAIDPDVQIEAVAQECARRGI